MMSRNAVRWVGAALVALLVLGVVAGSCGGGGGSSSSTSLTDSTQGTVPRDGDPDFCAAIVGFQDAYTAVAEPAAGATPAQVEAGWDDFSAASGRLVETAPTDMAGVVQPVVSAFDTLRQDAAALGFDYDSFDDLESSATIDPQGQIAQSAYVLFTYGADRCPIPTPSPTTTALR